MKLMIKMASDGHANTIKYINQTSMASDDPTRLCVFIPPRRTFHADDLF